MKKNLLFTVILLISCFALRAQTTEIKFFNSSLSYEIRISIPNLFEGEIPVLRDEYASVIIDNNKLSEKKYSAQIYYSSCGGYIENVELIIGKYNKIGDVREPCAEAKTENCHFPEGRAFVKLINGTGKEISILDGPLNGLSLFPNQESVLIDFPVGRNSLLIESFIDTNDHNKGVDKRNYKFFAIQDSSCLCKVVIKTIEESQAEDLRAKLKIRVGNKTDRKVSIVSYPFDGISLLSGRVSSNKDAANILAGIYSIKIEFLDNYGNKVSKEVLKHIVEGDKSMSITQRDIDMPKIPTITNYNYKRSRFSRSSRGYYGGYYR